MVLGSVNALLRRKQGKSERMFIACVRRLRTSSVAEKLGPRCARLLCEGGWCCASLPSAMSVGKNKKLSKGRKGGKKKMCVPCSSEGFALAGSNGYRS